MTKTFEEEAIKEAKKCRVVMNAYDGEANPPKAGLNLKLGWATHNFPWLEFAKNWHSDEEFQAEKDARKKEYEIHQDIYSKTAHSLTEAESKIANLKSQLQQQALPVVPEFVDKFLKSKPIFNIVKYPIPIEIITWANKQTGYMDLEINITYLVKLKANGYTVEKPQLFYLKHIDMSKRNRYFDFYLEHDVDGLLEHKRVDKGEKPGTGLNRGYYTYTQAEIDSMKTGSYEKIEVAE